MGQRPQLTVVLWDPNHAAHGTSEVSLPLLYSGRKALMHMGVVSFASRTSVTSFEFLRVQFCSPSSDALQWAWYLPPTQIPHLYLLTSS